MKSSLVSLLRSPIDGSRLTLEVAEQTEDEVKQGCLVDVAGNRFPIVYGIPLFAQQMARDETFAFKWRLIGDSWGHDERSRLVRQDWYLQRFGFHTHDELLAFLRTKPMILEAGAGSGADAAMFAESGAEVIAFDLCEEAVRATYRRLGHLPNVHVFQADLHHLPFSPGLFDYVSCDQVLHHTPDPSSSFAALVRHLRRGAHLAVYVYKRKGPIRELVDDYLRTYATQMTAQDCYDFCRNITLLGKALSELKAEVSVPTDIPLLDVKAGRQDVQRFIYWNFMKCFWNDQYDLVTNVLINFDWYHPKYAFRFTPEVVRGWFEQHGLEIERLNVVPSGIAALGKLSKWTQSKAENAERAMTVAVTGLAQ